MPGMFMSPLPPIPPGPPRILAILRQHGHVMPSNSADKRGEIIKLFEHAFALANEL
jgi:hypothetical protein